MITKEQISSAQKCLINNGIEAEKSMAVLRTLGYILLNKEIIGNKWITEFDNPYEVNL